MLAKALTLNRSLVTLDLRYNGLVAHGLTYRDREDWDALDMLLHALPLNRTLEVLDVRHNGVTVRGKARIEAALAKSPMTVQHWNVIDHCLTWKCHDLIATHPTYPPASRFWLGRRLREQLLGYLQVPHMVLYQPA